MKQLISAGFDASIKTLSMQSHSAIRWLSLESIILPELLSESIQQDRRAQWKWGDI